MGTLLSRISGPKDLKRLNLQELQQLAGEIRELIVETVSKTGGHLGPNLGAVEIALALHSVLDAPNDKIIWDVGHQAYPHKLLTGRRSRFHTLRQYGGISGFPVRTESPYDAFGTAHGGTSISAAVGYAIARDRLGEDYAIVTVTGDGALTAGMAFEALNHAGDLGLGIVVVVNDNEMSISPNVGALSEYLTRLRTDPTLNKAKHEIESLIARIPAIGGSMVKAGERLREAMRHLVAPGAFFEELGFKYYGPIDGHNIELLQRVIREAVQARRPVVVHAITEKGRGYAPAERDPGKLHAIGKASSNGKSAKKQLSYSQIFGDCLADLAETDPRIIGITAAMASGTGLDRFEARHPDRFVDVGMAEQHAVTFAAGLACGGMRPVVAIYSTFLQRAYDQIIHDVAIQNLPVTFAIDRAGLVGDDGPTHHGCFDISYLRAVPNMVLMAPKDELEMRDMLHTALTLDCPAAFRFPRGAGRGLSIDGPPETLPIGKGETLREGDDVALVAYGTMAYEALRAAEILSRQGVEATVVNARFAKPLDEELIVSVAQRCGRLVTIEDGALPGGFGSACLELLAERGLTHVKARRLGIPDRFIEHGAPSILYEVCGLTAEHLCRAALELIGVRTVRSSVSARGE